MAAHDCGVAPRPSPVSGFQYSEKWLAHTPRTVVADNSLAMSSSPWRWAASISKKFKAAKSGPASRRQASTTGDLQGGISARTAPRSARRPRTG